MDEHLKYIRVHLGTIFTHTRMIQRHLKVELVQEALREIAGIQNSVHAIAELVNDIEPRLRPKVENKNAIENETTDCRVRRAVGDDGG